MRAMVFAAGFGRRLRPMTDKLPKALVPLGCRPMIELPLLLLKHYGIREVIINLHHRGNKIEEVLGSGKKLGLKIRYSREEDLLDTGGGLLRVKPFLEEGTFIVINSDVLIDLPLSDLLAYHSQKKATATLVLRADEKVDQYGPIGTASDGRVQSFLGYRLPHPIPTPLSRLMFTGVQIMEPKVFDYMDSNSPFSLTRVTYPRMLLQGEPLYGFAFQGYWQDLGTLERIKEAEEKMAAGEVKLHYL
ncbi:MAG: NDP-sugar synthase [Candidatus Binatia bacterium]